MFNKKSYTAVFVKDSLNYYMLLDINCIFQVVVLSSISSQRGKKWKYVIDFYGIFWGNFFFFFGSWYNGGYQPISLYGKQVFQRL